MKNRTGNIVALVLANLLFLLGVGSMRASDSGDTPRVGQLRNFDHFAFEGAKTFPGRQLWLALNSTFDFPELSHPAAPRDVFLAAIEDRLRLGYKHCGFPDVQVAAEYDAKADRTAVKIKEGIRYVCDRVEVTGARKIPIQPLITALSVTNDDNPVLRRSFEFLDSAPANRNSVLETNASLVWIMGQPAHFDDIALQYLSDKVTATLAGYGFYLTQFELRIHTNTVAGTATLEVKVKDEGPVALVGNIEITGSERDSQKTLLEYVGLKNGMKFTSGLAALINDRLYHSARFLTNSVTAGIPDSKGALKVTVAVIENKDAPALTNRFNATEQAALKARDWFSKFGDSTEDVIVSISPTNGVPDLECILSPRHGFLLLEKNFAPYSNCLNHAFILSADRVGLYAPKTGTKYIVADSTRQFHCRGRIETLAPGPDGKTGNFSFDAGVQSLNDATNLPSYAMSLSMAPAMFLKLLHETNGLAWFSGKELIISNASFVLKIDSKTGRIIRLATDSMTIHFESGAFTSAMAGIESPGNVFINAYNTNTPVGSAFVFFVNELLQVRPLNSYLQRNFPSIPYAHVPELLRQLEKEKVWIAFKGLSNASMTTDSPLKKFEIPEHVSNANGGTVAALAQASLMDLDLMLPPDSWPWVLSRDVALVLRGQATYVPADLPRIYGSNDTGPIGFLACASLLKAEGAPASRTMANRGIERLSLDNFRNDYRTFLDERYIFGQFVARCVTAVADMDDAELNSLLESMKPATADFVRDCAKRIRTANKSQSLVETLGPALDDYWEKGLKQIVAVELEKMADK